MIKYDKIEIGKIYKLDFGWNFEVTGFKENTIEAGAWKDETFIKGLKWNDRYGKTTAHYAYTKICELTKG